MRNVLMFVALAFVVAGVAGFLYFWPVTTTYTPQPVENIACTLDARVCPDGSYVGRVAPTCEFALKLDRRFTADSLLPANQR